MTLRETFLKDPFFHSAWQDMERTRQEFLANSREEPAGEGRTGRAVAVHQGAPGDTESILMERYLCLFMIHNSPQADMLRGK